MRKHRLIERMIEKLRVEVEKVKEKRLDPVFIDQAVAFSEPTGTGLIMARRRIYSSVSFR